MEPILLRVMSSSAIKFLLHKLLCNISHFIKKQCHAYDFYTHISFCKTWLSEFKLDLFYFIFIFIGLLENKKLTSDSLMGLFIYKKVYISIINQDIREACRLAVNDFIYAIQPIFATYFRLHQVFCFGNFSIRFLQMVGSLSFGGSQICKHHEMTPIGFSQ